MENVSVKVKSFLSLPQETKQRHPECSAHTSPSFPSARAELTAPVAPVQEHAVFSVTQKPRSLVPKSVFGRYRKKKSESDDVSSYAKTGQPHHLFHYCLPFGEINILKGPF